jgi:glutathione synthase/RimK-type ligase-like ATP-grasp enzyme
MVILGVYREKIFSPGRVDDDARILEATLRELARAGHTVRAVHTEELASASSDIGCVITMAESPWALAMFESMERRGTRIINCVDSIKNCHRKSLVTLLQGAGLPMPGGWVVPVEDLPSLAFKRSGSYWLKRSDFHCVRPGDVVRVRSRGEMMRAIGHFREGGIEEIVMQEHVEGEVVKFYGVNGSSYFSAFLLSHDREDVTHRVGSLKALAARAAQVIGLEVFGGDAVITSDGRCLLIDVNCWPSFSCCRQPAAKGIAAYVAGLAEERFDGLSVPY